MIIKVTKSHFLIIDCALERRFLTDRIEYTGSKNTGSNIWTIILRFKTNLPKSTIHSDGYLTFKIKQADTRKQNRAGTKVEIE